MPDSKANASPGGGDNKDEKKAPVTKSASVGDTLSFIFGCGGSTPMIFFFGVCGGFCNGLVFPILAYLFSNSFSDIAGAANEGLAQVRRLAYLFLGVGVYALIAGIVQTCCFEIVAYRGCQSFRLQWFRSLLRQDTAFFDVHDIGGLASSVGPSANRYRRGVGRKFGEGIQFFVTGVGGLAYAFYASWRVALVVLCVCPLISLAAVSVVSLNQTKSQRASAAYGEAGSVAYSTVASIRTVLSLNALPKMLASYQKATQTAYNNAVGTLPKQGFANGSMLGAFILLYAVLALYGTALLYRDIEDTGCDPSDGVTGNASCTSTGPDVFGAMLGVAFAAQGISQVGNFLETFSGARTAAYSALEAINRKPGAPKEIVYEEEEEKDEDKKENVNGSDKKEKPADDVEGGAKKIRAILPEYLIDSTSNEGLKPENVEGRLTFSDIKFEYPTRPNDLILKGLSLDVEPGKTVAFVGPSGGGKSTIVKLLERFYDPVSGSVNLDGTDIKEINVKYLRSLIGYVGQEPTLFATSIGQNIKYGNPSATQEQIEQAAKMANAHDFISSFPEGYDTQVGDKGTQLSGGQKQRIAIARVLVGNPKILLLDEATSALDSESELVVQEALDNVLAQQKRTTVIIAHRLSTIRNADIIAVISGGTIVETGSHDELMVASTGYYRRLVEKQTLGTGSGSNSLSSSRASSEADLTELGKEVVANNIDANAEVQIAFKSVSFSYPTRKNKKIMDDFTLEIKKGETVALVGPSGGGKSTTVALIERFYDPAEGTVEFLGNDIKTLHLGWYRDQIGYVGQEPTLFNDTIANNIAYGFPDATREQIEHAARQANAHDFIQTFPNGYDTRVGERGVELSGGQKQRVAIARALVKHPRILLLDEATSALDNESEAIVQEALDKLMESREHTTIVIAHRLSTIKNADRIAFIAEGKVKEFGSHDELVDKPNGRYKRLVEAQKRTTTAASLGLNKSLKKNDEEEEEEQDWEKEIKEEEKKAFSAARARQMASPDAIYIFLGAIGAIFAGGVFPMWGLLFAETIELLFVRILPCSEGVVTFAGEVIFVFESCEAYWEDEAQKMKDRSFIVALYWAIVAVGCIVGNILAFWGFGTASERLNKRTRDSAFASLVRQEVAFFDKRSVGSITSQLQDDAAKVHTFSGEPIRSFLIAVASVITGIALSFAFMWPFALVGIACVPLMGFATSLEMKQFLGEDEGVAGQDELNSPGGIIVETLLNIRTVSALTLEEERFKNYENALLRAEPDYVKDSFMAGVLTGCSQFIQQWINGLQLWWGGWVLFNYPRTYDFNDFLISNFALLFSLFGLGAAFQDMSDRKETEESAGRIFYLLDRKSLIDPLGEEGKKLD